MYLTVCHSFKIWFLFIRYVSWSSSWLCHGTTHLSRLLKNGAKLKSLNVGWVLGVLLGKHEKKAQASSDATNARSNVKPPSATTTEQREDAKMNVRNTQQAACRRRWREVELWFNAHATQRDYVQRSIPRVSYIFASARAALLASSVYTAASPAGNRTLRRRHIAGLYITREPLIPFLYPMVSTLFFLNQIIWRWFHEYRVNNTNSSAHIEFWGLYMYIWSKKISVSQMMIERS